MGTFVAGIKSLVRRGVVVGCGIIWIAAAPVLAQVPAGYSEYYIPGPEDNMFLALDALDQAVGGSRTMHSVITVTAWSDDTRIYYDHWENGYGFDPVTGAGYDRTDVVAAGGRAVYEAGLMVLPRTGNPGTPPATTCTNYFNGTSLGVSTTCFDGRDRLYVAGGAVTVTRVSWIEGTTIGMQSVAWEIYPVRPQLTTYVVPFGESATAGSPFRQLYTLVQATAANTTVRFDINGDGTWDTVDSNRSGTCDAGDTNVVTLAYPGDTFLLRDATACVAAGGLPAGVVIEGDKTLQVKYIAGNVDFFSYVTRGFSAFPRGFWTTDYYAPLGQPTGGGAYTDYILYNPSSNPIAVDWESSTAGGTFTIPGTSTVSFRTAAGQDVPTDSGLYFSGSDVFWGVGLNDATNGYYEWGYSLLPSTMLYTEHYLGWAPGSSPVDPTGNPGTQHYDGAFLIAAQDNTRVFIDYDGDGNADLIDTDLDGTPESSYVTLNRLENQYFYDPTDGNLSGAHVWATGAFSMAYGENADVATTTAPALDVGYVAIPAGDFMDLVLAVDKSASPQVVPTASGSAATFGITVNSRAYSVTGVSVTDTLPPYWEYLGPTTITLPDMTQLTTAPTITGAGTPANPYVLTWPSSVLGAMAENQEITIVFTARTTTALAEGTLSQNRVEALGTRSVGGLTQYFRTSDFAYVVSQGAAGATVGITKTSSVGPTVPVYPGDTLTYTITVNNPAGSGSTLTGVTLYDALPAGVTMVSGTTTLSASTVGDRFGTVAYNNSDGSRNWAGNWNDSQGDGANAGDIRVTGGQLRLTGNTRTIHRQVDLSAASAALLTFSYSTSNNVETGEYAYVRVASSAAGPWTTVLSFQNDDSGTVTYAIPPGLLSATTTVQAYTTSYDSGEYFYVDNVFITYNRSVTGGDPPDLLSSNYGYALAPGQSLTATFNVTVDNPLPAGLTSITNTASTTSTQLPVQIYASATNIVTNPAMQSATVGDRVWLDADGDGVQDIGEAGIGNVEVTLRDQWGAPLATTVTDGNGRYLFTGVPPATCVPTSPPGVDGCYYVEVTASTLPGGLSQSFPAGYSNNRTTRFDLTSGQNYVDADLGYRASALTASFGDIAWVDHNGNGLRDAGEIGLAGVTVNIYQDLNANGVADAGEPVAVPAVTTNTDGSYLFTGLPASGSQDYVVAVTTPSGHTATTLTYRGYLDVPSGSVFLNADFGFQSTTTTYSLVDIVWFDSDADGAFDSAPGPDQEHGIAGVMVELLDASLNVIGTATTASDGTFTFSGLTGGGADYTTRISDTGGILTDYYGTTTYALARERAESNVTGNVDHSAAPSYGFAASRAIGDTLYYDENGDDDQDTGEGGMAGIVVGLYTDADGDGRIEAGDTLVATLTTDINGNYLFAGLANGNYVVSVPAIASYNFTGTDSDPGTDGAQLAATISGLPSVLTLDFGFLALVPRSLAGTVWYDANADGVFAAGETGIENVTLDVLLGGSVIATLTTDSNGEYSLDGLAPASYTVRVTDTSGTLTGYAATDLTNPEETADLTSSSATGIDFGYVRAQPTFAAIAYLKAYLSGGSVMVEWRTSIEVGTAGFHLLRLDPASGRYERIESGFVPGMPGHPQGGTYRLQDRRAPVRGTLAYKLVEVDVRGHRRAYGPYSVIVDGPGSQAAFDAQAEMRGALFHRRPAMLSRTGLARLADGRTERRAADFRRRTRHGTALKLTTNEEGLHYVGADQLTGPLGLPSFAVTLLLRTGGLVLSNRGKPVPYLSDASRTGFYFYAEPAGSVYTDQNVYQLSAGRALTMAAMQSAGPSATAPSFQENVRYEVNEYPVPVYFQDPESDFWVWDYLFAGYEGMDSKAVSVAALGISEHGSASLAVHLLGGTNSAHQVTVRFNGTDVAQATWDGISRHDLEIPLGAGAVLEGDNTVEVRADLAPGVSESLVLLDSIDLTYHRIYRASGDTLDFTAAAGTTIEVTGFSVPDVLLLDITTPARPVLLTKHSMVRSADGTYSLRFGTRQGSAPGRYLALTPARAKTPADIAAWSATRLRDRSNRAKYVLIAPDALEQAAAALAGYRSAKGVATTVVGLDAIYDEFNDGIAEPTAIREFLRYASTRWAVPPRAAALIGRGTWDYKNRLGFGDNLVPPLLAASPDGLFASDVRLADLAGDDGVPEIAIGRVPVVTSEELADYVAKIEIQESAGSAEWQHNVLMTADNPDGAGAFTTDSDAVAALLPHDRVVQKVSLSDVPADVGRQAVIAALNSGVSLFNFIGHGGFDRLADEDLFTSADVPSLTNAGRLPLFVAMTCSIGNFAMPGYPSLAETMLLDRDGGACAVWAPSGLSQNDLAVRLNKAFFASAFAPGAGTIGSSVQRALRDLQVPNAVSTRYMYNLIGEPVTRLPN